MFISEPYTLFCLRQGFNLPLSLSITTTPPTSSSSVDLVTVGSSSKSKSSKAKPVSFFSSFDQKRLTIAPFSLSLFWKRQVALDLGLPVGDSLP